MAVGNSGDIIISQTSFYGGTGTDDKIGIKNSYADSECVDARKNPSVMTVLPGSRKLADDDLDGLIVAMEQTPDGIRWGVSDKGDLYKIDLANDITKLSVLPDWDNGTQGSIVYWENKDCLFITGLDRIYKVSPVVESGTPKVTTLTGKYSTYPTMAQILIKDRDGKWVGGGTDRWTFKNGSSGRWMLPWPGNASYKGGTTYEAANNKCIFLPDQTPMTAIEVKVTKHPAEANVTIEIHDEADKLIATDTKPLSAITNDGKLKFTFPRVKLQDFANFGAEYHIHLYADKQGVEVAAYQNDDLMGLHYWYYAALLLATNKKVHPIINWGGTKLLVGNGQYLVDWLPSGLETVDWSEFKRHKIIVENGMEITSLTSNDEYVVIGCEKVGKAGTRVYQQGMIAFWDGFTDGINFKIDTPMGEPKSLYTYQNITYMIIDGALYCYTGAKALAKVRTIQESQSEFTGVSDTTDVFSYCMAVRRGILLLAYPSVTTLQTMRHGIYSYGSVDKDYPNCFYYSYSIPEESNYNTDTKKLTLGGVWNFGDTLYFSYKVVSGTDHGEDIAYNMAIVDNTSTPATKFKYDSLKYDGGMPWKAKEALRIAASFDPLPKGCEIRMRYKIDHRPWVEDTRAAKEGETEVYFDINKRFREIQFGIVGTNDGTSTTPARVTAVGLNARELKEEGKMHR